MAISHTVEDWFQPLLRSLDCGVVMIDSELRVVAYNPQILALLELPATLVESLPTPLRPILKFMARRGDLGPGEVEALVTERLRLTRRPDSFVMERIRHDGLVLEIRHQPLPEGRGVLLIYRDITHHQRREQALRESETRLRDVARSTSDWFWEMDASLRFTWASENYSDQAGFDASHHLGKTREEIGAGLNQDPVWRQHLADLAAKRPFRDLEYCQNTPRGRRWVRISGTPIFDDTGRFRGYRGTGSDITDLVQARQLAHTTEARFFQAIEAVPEQFALYDADDRLVIYNSRFREMQAEAGVSVAPGMRFSELLDALLARHAFPEAWGQESAWRATRLHYRHQPEGASFEMQRSGDIWLQVREQRLPDGGVLSICLDISELKRAEQALRLSEQRFQDFALAASDWFWEMDEELRFNWLSDHYENQVGYSRSWVLGKTRAELGETRDDPDDWAAHLATLAAHRPFRDFEYLQHTHRGSRWMRVNGIPVFDEGGGFRGYRGTGSDITALHQARQAAHTAQSRLSQAIEAIRDTVIALFDADDRLVAHNSRFGRLLQDRGAVVAAGMGFESFLKLQLEHGLIQDMADRETWLAQRLDYHRHPVGTLEVHLREDIWLQIREERLDDGATLVVATEITELKRTEAALRESEARFRDFAEEAADVFWETDAELRYIYVSEHCLPVLGGDPAQILGHRRGAANPENFRQEPDKWRRHLEDLAARRRFQMESVHHRPDDGRRLYVRTSGRPIFGPDGEFQGYRGVIRDITQEQAMLERIHHQARHDPLTGLVNRQEFERRLENALASLKARGTPYALCFLDLDQFKVVNDTVGHQAGDQLLQQLTGLLLHRIRQRDTLGRLGGDEFGLLLENCPLDKAEVVAQTLVATVGDYRFFWQERLFQVGASIGMVALDADAGGIQEAMTRADVACYTAKELGRNRVHVWRDGGEPARQHSEILRASELREALLNDRFCLLAQPIVDLASREPRHWEILLRLQGTDGQLIPPGAFLPAAERYGVMAAIDHWVIRRALACCRHLAHGRASTIALNLSTSALDDGSLIPLIDREIRHHGLNPGQLIFEITETTAMGHLSRTTRFLAALQELGCRFALDNFGSGLSSLTHLKDLPVDYLKVEGRLVRAMVDDPIAHTMVATLAEVGRLLEIATVAEGVEDAALTPHLQALGIGLGQGYALGRPGALA